MEGPNPIKRNHAPAPVSPAPALLAMAEATDPNLVVGGAPLPEPAPATLDPKAPKAKSKVKSLLELLYNVSPVWDDVLRSRVVTKAEAYNDLLDQVRVSLLAACWKERFHLTSVGEGDAKVYELAPNDGQTYSTRLDVLEDAGTTSVLLDGKPALLLFVDTVAAGQAILVQGNVGHPVQVEQYPARKADVLVIGEGWTSLDLPQLPPRTNRTALLIRLLS